MKILLVVKILSLLHLPQKIECVPKLIIDLQFEFLVFAKPRKFHAFLQKVTSLFKVSKLKAHLRQPDVQQQLSSLIIDVLNHLDQLLIDPKCKLKLAKTLHRPAKKYPGVKSKLQHVEFCTEEDQIGHN